MILGVGTDLCSQKRVDAVFARHGQRFLDRICSPQEQKLILKSSKRLIPRLAQAFAAKEACTKALGTGFSQGVFWKDMVLGRDPLGKPTLTLLQGALKRAHMLRSGSHYGLKVDVSLADDAGLCLAFVVLSQVPTKVT